MRPAALDRARRFTPRRCAPRPAAGVLVPNYDGERRTCTCCAVPGCPPPRWSGGQVVLSLGKLAPGQQQYYLDTVARGAEEYYTGAREAPGEWLGPGAARLGLSGEVDAEALGRLLNHDHPGSDVRLTGSRSVPVVAGFDATFCAPKSVSLLFAFDAPEVSNQVRNCHDAALAAAMRVLEDEACVVRRGAGGATVVDGDGFVAAAFRHRTSRAAIPICIPMW